MEVIGGVVPSLSRRRLGRLGLGAAAGLALRSPSFAARILPGVRPIARVIVDNDFAGDPDGLVALAYQLLAPTTQTVLVTASAVDARLAAMVGNLPAGQTAAAGVTLATELIKRAGLDRSPPVAVGSESFGTGVDQVSPAARAIVAEARRNDPLPLFVTCGGPLTNVAAALRLDPGIARRLTLIWIGGRSDPSGGAEYNLATDLAASRQVLETSDVPLWQVPLEAYQRCFVSHAELATAFRPISPLTDWLYRKLEVLPPFVPPSGNKGLGDCASVPLAAVSPDIGQWSWRSVRHLSDDLSLREVVPGRMVRMYEEMETRALMADLFATLSLQGSKRVR